MTDSLPKKTNEILSRLEVDLFELVGDKFAPKQAGGSPERKSLLGLIGPAWPIINEAEQALLAAFREEMLEIIGEDEPAAEAIYKAADYGGTDEQFQEAWYANELAKAQNKRLAKQRQRLNERLGKS